MGDSWQREDLWTLYSLQEGVSRFKDTPEGIDRGQGTVHLIELFHKLGKRKSGEETPKMCLISGSTYILFDGKYQMQPTERRGEKRKIIAFNKQNDLAKKPDSDYVKRFNGFFPGTLISMSFFLDKEYLKTLAN